LYNSCTGKQAWRILTAMSISVPPTQAPAGRPRLGVSSCLLGERVRFDSGHKRDGFVHGDLARFVEFVPRCPEVAIGLGTPREPIHLVRTGSAIGARGVRSGREAGERLAAYGRDQAADLGDLCGYVFKSKSPSCGLERVPVYGENGRKTGDQTRGLYAEQITRALPWLPVEEEGRLHDPGLRDSFLIRVFTLHRLAAVAPGGEAAPGDLVEFHTRHKYLVLAHDVDAYRRLGRLVAGAGREPRAALFVDYRDGLMAALSSPARIPRHVNVLQHLIGYLRGRLDPDDRAELLARVEEFRAGRLPWIAVRTLLRHHFRRYPDPFVNRQVYLEPYPDELAATWPGPARA